MGNHTENNTANKLQVPEVRGKGRARGSSRAEMRTRPRDHLPVQQWEIRSRYLAAEKRIGVPQGRTPIEQKSSQT